ncbi:unnamed protein product [Ilex paraguariensis]|uniref:H/ACA ribonucleoprotein complex non-core subunit NAF1 n=1 Tax=Ilex paraguariensis TaxID=185542 RepID=A0ABC8SVL0_9AQUA
MVSFIYKPTSSEFEEEKELNTRPSELEKANHPLDRSLPEVEDFDLPSDFVDSFLDFDSIKDWMEENPEPYSGINGLTAGPERVGSEKVESVVVESNTELVQLGSRGEIKVEDSIVQGSAKLGNLGCLSPDQDESSLRMAGIGVFERGIEVGKDKVSKEIKVEDPVVDEFGKVGSIGCLIEEEMERVSLNGVSNSPALVVDSFGAKTGEISSVHGKGVIGNDVKSGAKSGDVRSIDGSGLKGGDIESDEDESDSESESESASSSSSASSSTASSSSEDDADEEEEEGEEEKEEEGKGEVDMEEGEIRDSDAHKMVAWSDDDDDEENGGGSSALRGPIKSKNELGDLPPVPPVNVTLQPYHQTLPVGVVMSIMGTQVIVEGMEKHNPLNEGSILWITESRSPLGLVDEIFGPVKNPYYMIRYNSDSEVPAGIQQGTLISFVPEFANHVLNDNNLYKKGYDASGENDEEVFDEVEFSDDEKEAEYRRMLKMTKRGTNDQKSGNRTKDKKFKNRGGNWKNNQTSMTQATAGVGQPLTDQNQLFIPPVSASLSQGNCPRSSESVQSFAVGSSFLPTFPQVSQAPGLNASANGVWANTISCQQPQNMGFASSFSTNGMAWQQQNRPQQHQMPLPNVVPFQQFDNSQMVPSNFVLPGGQSNFVMAPPFTPWPASLGQHGFNQPPFGVGLTGQHAFQPMNVGAQVSYNGSQMQHNYDLQPPPFVSGNNENSQRFSHGVNSCRGRKPNRRGGGRFGGGRGRQHS